MAYVLDRSRDAIFIERLHAKTMARSLPWSQTEHQGRFQVTLGGFLVEIGEGSAVDEAPEILICGDDGRAIELLTPGLMADPETGLADARLRAFVETYEGARRIALGVDRVIDRLILALV
jgi:hypothetical protein